MGMVDETVNETKLRWVRFFAWVTFGVALSFNVLSAMTIGIFVLPFVIAGFLALLKWGGNRKNSVGVISGAGFPFLFIAYLNRSGPGNVCIPFGVGGEQCTQEGSPWPWLIIGVALAVIGAVLFLRIRSRIEIDSIEPGSEREDAARLTSKKMAVISLVVVITIAVLVGRSIKPAPIPLATTEGQRVQQAFQQMSVDVAKKDHLTSVKLNPVLAGVELLANGTKASVWVTGPTTKGVVSRCFYVDISTSGSVSTFGGSGCGGPGRIVSLNRVGSAVVGDIGTWPVTTVLVTVGDVSVQEPVTSGYFVVPGFESKDEKAYFTVSFTEIGGSTCKVMNIQAPGSSSSVECVIA